jgi:hypothetical protein
MPLHFRTLLKEANLDPKGVRLLRHQASMANRRSPYTAWRDDRSAFETYQSIQRAGRRAYFDGQYWAAFVAAPAAKTLFIGIYKARLAGPVLDGSQAPAPGLQVGRGCVSEAGPQRRSGRPLRAILSDRRGAVENPIDTGNRGWQHPLHAQI